MKYLSLSLLLLASCASSPIKEDCEKFCSDNNEKVVSCERGVLRIKHEVFNTDIYECEKASIVIIR